MVDGRMIKKKYLALDKSDSISRLIGQLKLHDAKAALVFDKKKFLGVADTHLLVRTKIDPARMKLDKIIKRVPTLTGKEDIHETARLLFTAETRILPVIKDNKVIGVVNAVDIIKELHNTPAAKNKLSEIMSLTPITVNENERIGKAINIMKENHISRIPIVDKDGNIFDMIALTDLLFKFTLMQQGTSEAHGRGALTQHGPRTIRAYRDRFELNAFPVKDMGSPIIITASPDDTVSRTIDKMERFDISSIIVTEGKKPVGIVTTRDLLRLFLKDLVTL